MTLRGVVAAAVTLALAGLVGCSAPSGPDPAPVAAAWQEISPPPAPSGSTPAVRALSYCGDRWFATGAYLTPGADPRPAAWSSPDGRAWTALVVEPNTYWGERNIIYAAACHDDRLVAIGGKAGGAHGNPRISTWYTNPAGHMIEVEARPYTLFGGLDAVNTSRIAAGPLGWILTGNRASGAAAWLSPRGEKFEIIEGAPGLAHSTDVKTYASDVVATADGWLIVGARTPSGGSRDPAAWISADGRHWQPQPVPAAAGYEELQRAVVVGGRVVAVGPDGAGFGAWRRTAAGQWEVAGLFGAIVGTIPGSVLSLAVTGSLLEALIWTGAQYEIWQSADAGTRWRAVTLPAASPSGPDATAEAASGGGTVIVALDDGRGTRLWSWATPQ